MRTFFSGMTCNSCVKNIENSISGKGGVISIKVSLEENKADVKYDPAKTNPNVICDQIDDMGFGATIDGAKVSPEQEMAKCVVSIEGMTCNSCVKNIESNISGKPGILEIKVSLNEKKGFVTFDPNVTTPAAVADMIDDMGFEAKVWSESTETSQGNQPAEVTLSVKGMTCNSCVKTIEGNMVDKPGVVDIQVKCLNI